MITQETLGWIVSLFFEEGAEKVYVASCCGKLFAGVEPPLRCRTCGKENPEAAVFTCLADVDVARVPKAV